MSQKFPPHLEVLIRTIERDLYSDPGSVIGPLHELLRQCSSDEQLCYAYEQLGFAHLLLSEHRLAKIFYERALSLQPDNVYVLANLAHAVYELGDKAGGIDYGTRALRLKDELAMRGGKLEIGPPRGGRRHLISFSLYGRKARYCETAILNCQVAKHHFPEFVCRFYVDRSVPSDVIQRLREHSAEIVPVDGRPTSFPPTFWRFLALDDKEADRVLVRDADSIIDAREAYCVREWIASKKAFHVIRDDCCHTELIQAGLFGARAGIVGNVEQKIADFLASEENHPIGRFSDQLFLRKCLWPMVRDDAVTHDTVYGYGVDVRGIPADVSGGAGIRNQFIGANYANYRLHVASQDALEENTVYCLRILDAGKVLCEYEMDRISAQELQIFLPASFAKQIEAGSWRYEIVVSRQPSVQ